MRVSQGGHDVPSEKLQSRFARTIANLKLAIQELPHVLIYDNDDLSNPYHRVAVFEHGSLLSSTDKIPDWLGTLLPRTRDKG